MGGQICRSKKMVCEENPALETADPCCPNHSCTGKIVNTDQGAEPCGPEHCAKSCAIGQISRSKKMVCEENPALEMADPCCPNHSCTGKNVNTDQKTAGTQKATGAGSRLAGVTGLIITLCVLANMQFT